VDAGYYVDRRDRLTRQVRWEQLDEDFTYDPSQLDRAVVSDSQIRTVVRAFRDRLFTELFPGRTEVPKTLIFAKDDSHAEDIVRIVREEFGKGNDFCKKITHKVTGIPSDDLIAEFRNSYYPRIAVTVDMISTGTDIRPLEALIFMRAVKSRLLFEQMLGRGTRVVKRTELQAVTPDAREKTRFVIVDAVGVVEQEHVETGTLERKRSVPFKQLLEAVAVGQRDADTLSSLAGRLARLETRLTEAERAEVTTLSGGRTLRDLANALLDAIDPDLAATDAVGAGLAPAPDGQPLGQPQGLPLLGQPQGLPLPNEMIDRAVAPFDSPQLLSTARNCAKRSSTSTSASSRSSTASAWTA
jgi:type I restriction enzyme R subunit